MNIDNWSPIPVFAKSHSQVPFNLSLINYPFDHLMFSSEHAFSGNHLF